MKKIRKKMGSFFLNKAKRYTKVGVVANWMIVILPIIILILLSVLSGLANDTQTKEIKYEDLTGGEIFACLMFVLCFFLLGWSIVYKIWRAIFKPKKIKKEASASSNKKDDYWG